MMGVFMRIMVVDDSVMYRTALSTALREMGNVEVVKGAKDGQEAIDFLKSSPDSIDIITMDLEMPVKDGVVAIKEIRTFNPKVPIICFSSITLQGAEKTMEALEAGANDFATKITTSSGLQESMQVIKTELYPKMVALVNGGRVQSVVTNDKRGPKIIPQLSTIRPSIVAFGSSTGGPETLRAIFSQIKTPPNLPFVMVQHMPPLFTTELAKMLGRLSPLKFVEAKGGEMLEKGVCYLAPGDYHLTLEQKENRVCTRLDQSPKVCSVRPAVDNLFFSLAPIYKGNVLAFVLTGMGEDGRRGAQELKQKGATICIQDQQSAVVWGMPGAIHQAGVQDYILTPAEIVGTLNQLGQQMR